MNWMTIVIGAGVLYGTATAFAQEVKPPVAPAPGPKTEVKPAEQAVPVENSPLDRLNELSRQNRELKATIDAKEAKLLADKPELKAKLAPADEKLKTIQDQVRAAQEQIRAAQDQIRAALEERATLFAEADPELKGLYEQQAKIRAEMGAFFRRPSPATMKPKATEGTVPGVEPVKPQPLAPVLAPTPAPAPGGAVPAPK